MPGSPPRSTSEPFTRPPPSTLLSSPTPVEYLTSSSVSMLERDTIFDDISAVFTDDKVFPADFGAISTTSSSKVFHSPQDGHFPFHFELSYPHWLHMYSVFNFPAI